MWSLPFSTYYTFSLVKPSKDDIDNSRSSLKSFPRFSTALSPSRLLEGGKSEKLLLLRSFCSHCQTLSGQVEPVIYDLHGILWYFLIFYGISWYCVLLHAIVAVFKPCLLRMCGIFWNRMTFVTIAIYGD